jgi:GNAT superfamily N-acetyltransferase
MEQQRGNLLLTDDRARTDLPRIHDWLSNQAYWSLGRSLAAVTESVRCSTVYSVFDGPDQVAVARVITDGVVFAYLCDVFVADTHRRQGIGGWIVEAVLVDLREKGVGQVLLATRDAHALYQRSGFGSLIRPERWLELDLAVDDTT